MRWVECVLGAAVLVMILLLLVGFVVGGAWLFSLVWGINHIAAVVLAIFLIIIFMGTIVWAVT